MTHKNGVRLLGWAALVFLLGCGGSDSSSSRSRGTGGAGPFSAGGSRSDAFGNPGDGFTNPVLAGSGVPDGVPPPGSGADTCAQGEADTAPITPTVWLVIDGSGSMDEDFENDASRWQALRSALMDADGLVARLEQNVRFGMVLYSGTDQDDDDWFGSSPTPSECVDLVTVTPEFANHAALDAALPDEEPGGWTPTDRALEHVVSNLPVRNQDVLDESPDPVYVILATDGQPNDQCGGGGSRGGLNEEVAQRVLDATQSGVQMGMRMFVISLAGDDAELQQHLEEVADASGTGLPPFVPSNKDDLVATLQQIIGDATCQVQLEGTVTAGRECSGSVTLNGTELACNADDGWRLTDERTVQLTGSACDRFLSNTSTVIAEFPCNVFSPD